MTQLEMRAAAVAVSLLFTSGGLSLYNRWQRDIGAREQQIAQLEHQRRDAVRRADSLEAAYRVDTVRLTRILRRTDTLTATVERWKHDTLRVVEYVTRADSTIRACTAALATCDQRVGAERAARFAAESEVKKLRKAMPGQLEPWRHRFEGAVIGIAAWAIAGRVK